MGSYTLLMTCLYHVVMCERTPGRLVYAIYILLDAISTVYI